jgi:HAE1 family hydrophobic/amphiphilic exporter-1
MSSINGQDTSQITRSVPAKQKHQCTAAQDVQAALTRAQRRLPVDMLVPPSYRKVKSR